MTLKHVLLGAGAVALLGACAGNTADEARAAVDQTQDVGAAAAGLATAAVTTDTPGYVTNAAIGDLYEIQSSQLALQRSQSQGVRAFAQQMIADHTMTSNQLRPLAQQAGVSVPSALDARRQEMMQNLQSASADDFDDRYIDQQTAAHQEALTLHRGYADRGDNAQLRTLAGQVAPRVEQHLQHIQQLDQSSADD